MDLAFSLRTQRDLDADPEAVKIIYGSQAPVSKGPWYTLLEPRVPLFMARDKQEHARRRKVWDQSFTTKGKHSPSVSHPASSPTDTPTALLGYDSRITKAITLLLAAVERHEGRPMDVSEWFSFFVFDVMEDLAFNKSSNMLANGKAAYIFQTIRTDMYNIAFFTHLPWLLPFLKRTPVLNWNYIEFLDWIQKLIDERKLVSPAVPSLSLPKKNQRKKLTPPQKEPSQPDIFSPILDAYTSKPAKTQRDHWNLHGDAQLIVIAGSDSVAAALTHTFFHLAWDPILVKRLQSALDALPSLDHEQLLTVDLLDAVLHEVMRLHPPVPSGTQRVTPPKGMWIGERFVPGDTIVQVPSYTVFRDARAFEQPGEFIPERWTTMPELVRDRSVYIPFNTGAFDDTPEEQTGFGGGSAAVHQADKKRKKSRPVRVRRQAAGHARAA